MKARAETFGAIVATESPPALLYVNRAMARRLGVEDSPLWAGPEREYLSAPTGVRFALTDRCPLACEHCYADAGDPLPEELSDGDVRRTLDVLAEMGVFHVNFSGGEPFSRAGAVEHARYARGLGMVPNIATSGFGVTPEIARECTVFGQVSVSMDGVGEMYETVRGVDAYNVARKSIKTLLEAGANVSVSVVVSRRNIGHVPELLRHLRGLGAHRVFLLRWMPVGRGRDAFDQMAPEPEEYVRMFRRLFRTCLFSRMSITLECAFSPVICSMGVKPRLLEALAVTGCQAGRTFAAISADGGLYPCSFTDRECGPARELPALWEGHGGYSLFRERQDHLPQPCSSCEYLSLCRGGCPVVAEAVTGDFEAPDPGCPRVAGRSRRGVCAEQSAGEWGDPLDAGVRGRGGPLRPSSP